MLRSPCARPRAARSPSTRRSSCSRPTASPSPATRSRRRPTPPRKPRRAFPVVAKLCGGAIAHKSERGLVRLGLATPEAVRAAAADLLARARPEDGAVRVLVAEQVRGLRELIAGVVRDPVFGACVML